MTRTRYFGSYFPVDYQLHLINFLKHNKERIKEIAEEYVVRSPIKSKLSMVKQLIDVVLIQHLFNLVPCQLYTLFNRGFAPELKAFIENISGKFPGRTWISQRTPKLIQFTRKKLSSLLSQLIDDFYQSIGNSTREIFMDTIKNSGNRMEAPNEIFIGVIPPSQLFPKLNPIDRAKFMPYFNAMQYQSKEKLSSIKEMLGKLKQVDIISGKCYYRLAGTLGFVMSVPENKKFYEMFQDIENILGKNLPSLDQELIHSKIINLKVQSIDGTNIPVDDRDSTATNGSGSRGAFFGQKAAIAADANCIPLYSQVKTGQTSDINLFYPTFDYVYSIAYGSDQDIWATNLDAGYSSTYVIEYVEDRNIIPFVDLNSRKSKLLKELKIAAKDLGKLSKIAIKNGLSKEERKKYLEDIDEYQKNNGKRIPLPKKKKVLRIILRKYEQRAIYRGLSGKEKQLERQLRKRVMNARQQIRSYGTPYEKILALSAIPQGTVSWFLIYHIRGQNEGINGIIKKRDNLIGDGQKTSWIYKENRIRNRIGTQITFMKIQALVCMNLTKNTNHLLKRVYNWIYIFSFYIIVVNFVE